MNKLTQQKYLRCSECSSLLGIYSDKENCFRIKYKDLFLKCYGKVEIICRKCGKENIFNLNVIRL